MRDKIRNITPFKHGPAQTQEELNGQPDDSIFQKVATLVSNPFDGAITLGNQFVGGIQSLAGIDQGRRDGAYGNLSNLRRAKAATDAGTKEALSGTKGFNMAAQAALLRGAYGGTKFLSNALRAQTNAELLSGNPVSAILSKVKATDIVKNVAPLYATAKTAYYGYKGGNMGYGKNAKQE